MGTLQRILAVLLISGAAVGFYASVSGDQVVFNLVSHGFPESVANLVAMLPAFVFSPDFLIALLLGGLLALVYPLRGEALRRAFGALSGRSVQLRCDEGKFPRLKDAARKAFEETKIFHGYDQSPEEKLWHHIVLIAIEARDRPFNMTLWGCMSPSTKPEEIPTGDIDISRMAKDGTHILSRINAVTDGPVKWADLRITKTQLNDHIGRLKRKEAAGQRSRSGVRAWHSII